MRKEGVAPVSPRVLFGYHNGLTAKLLARTRKRAQ